MRRRGGAAVAVIAAAVLFWTGALFAARSAPEPDEGTQGAPRTHAVESGIRASPRTHAAESGIRASPRTHVVEIREFRFEPAELVVAAGDTVRWINRDPVPHTATASDSTWDSGTIEAGGQWHMVVRAYIGPGFYCVFHPTMTGTIRIVNATARGADPR